MDTMFTVEGSNLICIFAGESRNEAIEDIERALPYLDAPAAYMIHLLCFEKLEYRDLNNQPPRCKHSSTVSGSYVASHST